MNNLDLSQAVCLTTYDLLWFAAMTSLFLMILIELGSRFWKAFGKWKASRRDAKPSD